MATDVIELGDARFHQEVLESKEPVLVDFTATWCPPCRAIAPTVAALATEYRGRLKVAKLDVDANQETAQRYNIRSVPALLLFKDGQVVQQLLGAMPRAKLEQALLPHL
ncbi:thioredoxin [Myxococcus sp. XM-1-1-1]|uniref:thioredoxin n=1 Tax=Myxococcus sp. XM-1-1-1 TaxID=2874602 RepID=UPI001CC049FC|nr:thioredoxin [Myxococcus sp. XM-1-1-1]MBZ4413649.1 thioredoxin [Myxococcus sp. XM-1-1-1]BDT33111.1 thioredoxin [Myxococcus sp. MH1]